MTPVGVELVIKKIEEDGKKPTVVDKGKPGIGKASQEMPRGTEGEILTTRNREPKMGPKKDANRKSSAKKSHKHLVIP